MFRTTTFALTCVLTAVAAGAGAFAQQAAKPVFAPDGTVHVPAFDLPPSPYLSPEALALQKGRATMGAIPPLGGADINTIRAGMEKHMAPEVEASKARYPVDITEQEIAGVKTHVIVPKSGEANHDRVLIDLHGGAFSMCAGACAMLESIPITGVGRFKVVTVDYREGPENVFPAASEDVAAVYKDLLKTYKPENIGIYGCSAGGILTPEVEAWLQNKGLPNPGALGIFGAGAVRFDSGDSAYVAAYIDGSFPAPKADGTGGVPMSYFKGADMGSALVAPGEHPDVLAKFPPTLIITGTRAADMSPAVYTNSQLLKAGVKSTLIVGEGMGHCFIYDTSLPEARDTYGIIVRFFNENLGRKPHPSHG